MKRDQSLKLAIHTATKTTHGSNQALAAIRARTAMEVMRERSELTRNLYDVFGSGGEREETPDLQQMWVGSGALGQPAQRARSGFGSLVQ